MKYFLFILVLFLFSCASGQRSFVYENFTDGVTFARGSYIQGADSGHTTDAMASEYCSNKGYNSFRALKHFEKGIYYLSTYQCVNTDKTIKAKNKPSPKNINKTLNLDDAKNQCKKLGFKLGTEKFGECVLQLSD